MITYIPKSLMFLDVMDQPNNALKCKQVIPDSFDVLTLLYTYISLKTPYAILFRVTVVKTV